MTTPSTSAQWKLVPVEPTKEMLRASPGTATCDPDRWRSAMWAAMLAATPAPTSGSEEIEAQMNSLRTGGDVREAALAALKFYDGLGRPHEPGEARILDELQAALNAADDQLHGPFGHLVIATGLNEEHWRLSSGPDNDADHVSLPMFTKVDPFALASLSPAPTSGSEGGGEPVAWATKNALEKLKRGSPTTVEPAHDVDYGAMTPLYLAKPASEPAGGDVRDDMARAIGRVDGVELDWITDQTNPRWVKYRKMADAALAALSSSAGPAVEAVAWRDVVGFEGLYEVSDQGQIRSVKNGRILATHTMGDGYVKAEFWKEGVRTQTSAHRVVARAFLGEPPEGKPEVNHKDGDKLNNAPSNLEWCSRAENNEHSRYVLGNDVKPVTATDIETGVVESFPSIAEAGRRAPSHNPRSINDCLRGVRKTHAGKIWALAAHPAPATVEMREVLPGPAKQLDRVRIGEGEYVRADEAVKTVMQLQRQLYDADRRLAALAPATEGGKE